MTAMFASLAMSAIGGAAEWSVEPSVTLRREYNDNLNLSIFPHKSVTGSIITPALDFGIAMPLWQIGFGAEATQRRYSGQEGLDRDDSLFRFSSIYRAERSTWQLGASRRRDSVVTNEEVDPDTGASQSLSDRDTSSVNPSWIWMFSQTTQLQLGYQQTNVDYDDNALNTGLYDYRYRVITATLSKQLSERNQLFMTGGYSEYHVDETDFDSETRNLQVGLTRNFTESLKGTLQAGQRRTESFYKSGALICTTTISIKDPLSNKNTIICTNQTVVPQDTRSESRDSVFSGNLESKSESSDWSLAFSRALQPSSTGGQVEQDMLGFQFNKRLTPRLRMNIRGSSHKVRTFEGNFSNNDRKYYELGPGFFWQWTRDWAVGGNYRYVHVKREFENEAAESNSVNLLLTYRPLKMAISR